MMFSLPDFSVKRPVCVFICLVSLILFGVSSVFEMPLESTPEMNMPTMTIMTSYPDASPDEVDEMVTQKIESALSGITEVESMTSTSSEGSSMIMLEFGYDVDTDDKYQDITSALASMLSALTLVPLLFVKMRPREKLTSRSHVMMHALEGKYEALLRRALRARKTVVASAIACLAIAGFLFTQIDMELMPAGSTNTISVSVETRSGLDLENTNAIMEEIESMISEDPDVESYSLRVSGGGSSMDMMNSEFGSIGKALLIAVYLVFAVMAIQFESVIFSLVVLFSIPFSLTGAFLALYITGSSISMTSLIGLVMLAGIVVNNAIVLVDYAGTLRREGMEVHEALVTAGKRRLRPILMSSLTTIVGLIPMAAGFGGEVEMMQGMAVVVIGGLSLSTVLTLVLIPTFYLIFDREDRNNRRMQRKIAREVSSAQ